MTFKEDAVQLHRRGVSGVCIIRTPKYPRKELPMPHRLSQKHSITVAGHRTSITLEQAFWDSLKEIAEEKGVSINGLIAGIDSDHPDNLSSALRVFILEHYKQRKI
jgi:predicted DNA-binding ribbon-helix-helix protein